MNLPPGAVPLPKDPTLMELLELHALLDAIERERDLHPIRYLVNDGAAS